LEFDGNNDYVRLAGTTDMLGSGWETLKTVSFWMKPMGTAAVCANNSPAWCDNVFGDRPRWWGISRGVMNGLDRIWVWNYDGSSGSAYDIIGVEYSSGEWINITMVHSSGRMRVYVNGLLVGDVPSGATLQPSTGAQPVLHLGGVINNENRNWTFFGQLDEVRLWNRALSQEEIQEDMTRLLEGSEIGLKAYYQMSDGSGLTLTDDSIYSWNGTLYDGGQGVPPDGSPPTWVISTAFGD
jgi:hypothetical protein